MITLFTNRSRSGGLLSGTTITATTGFRAADGSVAAPSYSFTSDPGTGIYWRGTGDLGITLNNTLTGVWSIGSFGANGTFIPYQIGLDPAQTDAFLSRGGSGIVAIGASSTQGSFDGTAKAVAYQ